MVHKFLATILILSTMSGSVLATDKPNLNRLQAALGDTKPERVTPARIPGLYEVIVEGQVLYLSEDGRYVIQGDIVDLRTSNNVTEERRSAMRVKAVNSIGERNMVVFAPKGPVKHTVTVFTDIDCGYCRKLHREIGAYNDQGIKVRYLMFPRAGIGSESYNKAVSVWCDRDRKNAMTIAKSGGEIAHKSCPNPVTDHYKLGQSLGVRGTPSIILENGQMVPGYVPAPQLAQMLNGAGLAN